MHSTIPQSSVDFLAGALGSLVREPKAFHGTDQAPSLQVTFDRADPVRLFRSKESTRPRPLRCVAEALSPHLKVVIVALIAGILTLNYR
jgi:hypothetical protein